MAWTTLSFAYGSVLTSAKMTQMYDNFDAMATQASGAPNMHTGVLMALVNTTSGTTADFTIPSWAKKVWIYLNTVSTNSGASRIGLRLGDSGGIETTGYLSQTQGLYGAAVDDYSTIDLALTPSLTGSGYHLHGRCVLTLLDAATFTWACESSILHMSTSTNVYGRNAGTMIKSTSAAMTTIRIYISTGTFDTGSISVMYE